MRPRVAPRPSVGWTFVLTSIGLFMIALDNLIAISALPVIQTELGAGLAELDWIVNAYSLTFAVLLLTGAALGDRFGRRRMFVTGLVIFAAGSAGAAMAGSTGALIAARALQGIGGAIVMPLTLTILSAGVPPARRALALGAWGGIGGLAVAIGPLAGGAIVEGINWHWIFWINVPIGLAVALGSARRLTETFGPHGKLDVVGLVLASLGLLGLVWAVTQGNDLGWDDPAIIAAFVGGIVGLGAFVWWETRSAAPMLPLRLFRNRTFTIANAASFTMYFGVFGAIFVVARFLQVVQGYHPLEAGLHMLAWTGMPVIVAPIAGAVAGRVGGRPFLTMGLTMLTIGIAWLAITLAPNVPYGSEIPALIVSGIGMGLFFAPVAALVLSTARPDEEGKASGVTNALRQLGGVFGIAVLTSVFGATGSSPAPAELVPGLVSGMWVAAGVVGLGAVLTLFAPRQPAARSPAFAAGVRGLVDRTPVGVGPLVPAPPQPTVNGRQHESAARGT